MNNYYPIIRALYKEAKFWSECYKDTEISKEDFLVGFFAENSCGQSELTKIQEELLLEVLGDIE